MMNSGQAATAAWMNQVDRLLATRTEASPRGMRTREIVGSLVEVSMRYPVVMCPQRKLGYNFMAAEALWIISGSRSLDFHPEIRKKLEPYSDDGITLSGAYGVPFVEQRDYVRQILERDRNSRQAVIQIFPKRPPPSKDIPCTVSMQFMIRNEILHTNVFMRSSDVWMGLPYDIFSFSMMSMTVAIELKVGHLGKLTIMAGSSHLYDRNWPDAYEMQRVWDWKSTAPWTVKHTKNISDLMIFLTKIANSTNAKERMTDGLI